jgi:CARDB protein
MARRLAIQFLLLAAALTVAPPAAAADSLPASVRLVECSREQSFATFYARMRQVPGSERMWMRFVLLEKHLERYEALDAPALSRWHKSKPGVGAFGYRQTVRALRPGSVYRVQVSFRWYSSDGELIGRTRRRSAACRQFDAVPNLSSTLVGTEPTKTQGVLRYLLRVSNSGVAPAADVDVRLAVDGSTVDTHTVASLAPGDRQLVAISGPECTSSVESLADPDGVIVESSETDNRHLVPCADLPRT